MDYNMLKGEWFRLLAIVCGLLGAMLVAISPFLWSHGTELRKKQQEATKGELKAPTVDFSKPIIVYWGGIKMTSTVTELSEGININRFISMSGGDMPIKISFDEGKLYVSTEVKNEENETVAKLVDNIWMENTDQTIVYDSNYNDFAFEVIDSDMIPRLQVLLREDNIIYLGGYFNVPLGKVLATPHSWILNPTQDYIESFKEVRLFKYPREDYMGEMEKPLPDYEF